MLDNLQIDPDLARLIDGWPNLPPTVKWMILVALIDESAAMEWLNRPGVVAD